MSLARKYIASGFIDDASQIVNAFKQRVLADGGIFESDSYLIQWLKENRILYNRSGFILTPNAYKSGVLYAFRGQDYNTFTRAGSATRINANFQEEVMNDNVPRICYEHTNPVILAEFQTQNRAILPVSQTITGLTSQRYTLSFFGTGSVQVTGAYNETLVGVSNTVKSFTNFGNVFAPSSSVTITVTGNVFWLNFVPTGGNFDGSNQPSSHIPTTTSIVTRLRDNFNELDIGNSMFGNEFMLYLDYLSYDNDFHGFNFQLELRETSTLRFRLRSDGAIFNDFGFTGFNEMNNGLGRVYGRRIRQIYYFNKITNQGIAVSSRLFQGQWQLGAVRLVTNMNFGNISKILLNGGLKVKTLAITQDFTGITNMQAFMQDLALKNTI